MARRQKRVRHVAIFIALTVATFTAICAESGSATAATTIGSNLAAGPTVKSFCMLRACTIGQWILPVTSQAPGGLLAPYDGVVVRWRVKVGSSTLPSALVITRPGSSDVRSEVGSGPQVTPPLDQLSTYDIRVPIQAGDALALYCCTTLETNAAEYVSASTPGAETLTWRIPFDLGSGGHPYRSQDQELLINADIEPDCDQDGLGDETQDPNTSACPTCKDQPATIIGTSGDDVRMGTPGRDVMVGLAGNDTLSGFEGDDTICGGAGNDTLYGGPGNDILLGQKGKDKLFGEAGKDTLNGGPGKDKLKGGGDRDFCKGGKGKDTASKCEVRKSI
jgi:hypothetical protein